MTAESSQASCLDCLVVGAGPAGLTAATYLARFRRNLLLVDAGQSRARWIPASHNCPGFPFGGSNAVSALNQISVAVGHAAIAATAVHARLPPNPR